MSLQVSCLHKLALEASALQLPDPTPDAKYALKRVGCCIQWPAGTCKTCINYCTAHILPWAFAPLKLYSVLRSWPWTVH